MRQSRLRYNSRRMNHPPQKLLIVDDDAVFTRVLARAMTSRGLTDWKSN